MKVSFTCMNNYYSPEALQLAFTTTPRKLWDSAAGKRSGAQTLEQAALADALGFDFVSVSEHHYQAAICNPNAAVLAGALTGVVRRGGLALLGPLVSLNNPVRVAEEIAMLDQLSGGRLIALLRGTPNEFAFFNVPADQTRAHTEEAMLLIRKALTEPEPSVWKSEHYDFPVVSVWPGATQIPHPPLFDSANSDESIAFIAEHRFGAAMSYFGPRAVAANMCKYHERCREHGWEPTTDQKLFRAFCVIGASTDHAQDLEGRFTGAVPPPAAGTPGPALGSSTDSTNVQDLEGFGFGFLQFTGDPEGLVEQFRVFHELTGVGILDLSFNFGHYTHEETLDQLRLFGEKFLPRLRKIAPVAA
ncbi:Flavin-dependent oxidoreductase, luciferase family (includes alkanesulfonate monooxygenase SsuD and methylene tetrahydromethanopterin reductase) [Prauserella aidingensis]|uniref:LLM class flavin-dependent oxidoreductase n=1 Tax=Prauserella aidingensis TaxID=387890 RepID=UPI0020A2F592|nr:LLM class flavin-dependent oxidoreductase [Prauserella aidingensis]MCP2256131.1 Flavin-dependent oxidoreductase, luciferase family (includes alkanesulfonate monooxygenase SsuD and methylene tetrahydromethanopterin reductase) [Prauserella aidingensis]